MLVTEIFARLHRFLKKRGLTVSAETLFQRIGGPFAVTLSGMVITFGLQVLLARILGVNVYGEYIYVLAWVGMLVMVGKFGLDTAALRFLPEYSARGEWNMLRGYVRRSPQLAFAFSCGAAAIFAASVGLLSHKLGPELTSVFLVGSILLPLNVYLIIQASFLQAFHRVALAQFPQVIFKPVLLGVSLIFIAVIMKIDLSASEVMWLTVIVTVFTIGIITRLVHQTLPSKAFSGPRDYQGFHWLRVAFPMLLIAGFNMLINQLDILMVGALLGPTEAGIYAVVARLTMLIPFGLIVVNSIVAPVISRLYAQGQMVELQRLLSKVAWGSLAFSGPVFLVVVFWREQVLAIFGEDFILGSESLVYLAFSRLLVAVSGASGYLLSMSGNQNAAAVILGTSAVINAVLNYVFIPSTGIVGAAIASLIATLIWCVSMITYGKMVVGVNGSIFSLPVRVK